MKNLIYITFCIIILSGCDNPKKESSVKKTSPYQALVDSFSLENHNSGVVLLTENGEETNIYCAGYANKESETVIDKNNLFEIGSASKTFTAIAILQLVEKGLISLETNLNTIYPSGDIQKLAEFHGENYWNKVSVEMLLNHTCGFIDYLNIYDTDKEALEAFSNPETHYSFDDIIKLATDHGEANYIPGSRFEYCNTAYIILGDIITRISGVPWQEYITENVFKPADLKNTFFGSIMPAEKTEKLARGYYREQLSQMPYTLAGSAGEIVSDVYDLQKFLQFWAEGKFYSKPETFSKQITEGLNNMDPESDILQYALGSMTFNDMHGHGGQTFGFQSYMAINPETKDLYIVLINNADVSSLELMFNIVNL